MAGRVAIVDEAKCKPKECKLECKNKCPVNATGKLCIDVTRASKRAVLAESLCIGCGICVKRCPFGAITIINLPEGLSSAEVTHRYGENGFMLHRLPLPRPGCVLGLVGSNGVGKSTALKILAGKLKPNLGVSAAPEWPDIIARFRGSELQNLFSKLQRDELKAVIKPQYVDQIPKVVQGRVLKILQAKTARGQDVLAEVLRSLDLESVLEREVSQLSGGELQRFSIAVVCVQQADMYMFDEPSSYLDVSQRLRAAAAIRELSAADKYVVCVEHDLSVLDYLSDFVCCLYGAPGGFGVVSLPFGVREGINVFLAGFAPTDNVRFRDVELTFKIAENPEDDEKAPDKALTAYPDLSLTLGKFNLDVEQGDFARSEIIVLLGENGTGKTTFVRMLAGLQAAKEGALPRLHVSYKPQKIAPKSECTVRELLLRKIREALASSQFKTDVLRPLKLDELMDQQVQTLSGGELQRVAITLALGTPADVYLIDEPSAYLDSEQRIVCARVIKRFMMHAHKTAFVVEHDFIMATYLADRVIVYSGQPGVQCRASAPQPLLRGMNEFLKQVGVTFRRDPENHRPRINKPGSVKDSQQKLAGTYFHLDEDVDD